MSIQVSLSVISTKIEDIGGTQEICEHILKSHSSKMTLLLYLESRMSIIAPNVCEIIGPKVTSRLISSAGGIEELARIPAGNLQVLG